MKTTGLLMLGWKKRENIIIKIDENSDISDDWNQCTKNLNI